MTMTNEEIVFSVNQCLNGRTESFSPIVRHFQARITNLCLYYLKTPSEAEDAAAEVFIKAYGALATYNPQYHFSTWLYKIATNHSLQLIRRKNREQRYLDSLTEKGTSGNSDYRMVEQKCPEQIFFIEFRQEALREAIHNLPTEYRTALQLKYGDGLSYRDISAIMDIPVNTVGSLISRGKKVLRAQLNNGGAK
ncbi:MAG: sigma-70 family RNA polymerase sigma factor [bacterium]|nr:sigma-70 family RNA polymerase sigma factor [bacterium]